MGHACELLGFVELEVLSALSSDYRSVSLLWLWSRGSHLDSRFRSGRGARTQANRKGLQAAKNRHAAAHIELIR
jgi:hypothetical protein